MALSEPNITTMAPRIWIGLSKSNHKRDKTSFSTIFMVLVPFGQFEPKMYFIANYMYLNFVNVCISALKKLAF